MFKEYDYICPHCKEPEPDMLHSCQGILDESIKNMNLKIRVDKEDRARSMEVEKLANFMMDSGLYTRSEALRDASIDIDMGDY